MVGPSSNRLKRHPSNLVCNTRIMDADMCTRSLRELARRTLRSRGVIIRLPDNINREENLAIRLSDLSPSLYFGIEYKPHNLESIVVTNIGQGGGVIGLEEPDESEVWVPIDLQTGLDLFSTEIIALASAGYPACTGCGGPDAETPWDELSIRKSYF